MLTGAFSGRYKLCHNVCPSSGTWTFFSHSPVLLLLHCLHTIPHSLALRCSGQRAACRVFFSRHALSLGLFSPCVELGFPVFTSPLLFLRPLDCTGTISTLVEVDFFFCVFCSSQSKFFFSFPLSFFRCRSVLALFRLVSTCVPTCLNEYKVW